MADVLAVAVALPSVASDTLAPAEWSAVADAEPSPPLIESPALAESHSEPCELADTLAEPVQSQPEPDAEDQPHLLPLPLSALALGVSWWCVLQPPEPKSFDQSVSESIVSP